MHISQDKIKKILNDLIPKKIQYWNKIFPNLKFDEYGRAEVCDIPLLDAQVLNESIYGKKIHHAFISEFNNYLETKKYKIQTYGGKFEPRITNVLLISQESFIEGFMTFKTDKDKIIKVKTSKVLNNVYDNFIKKQWVYNELINEIRGKRQKGETYETSAELNVLTHLKGKSDETNLHMIYQSILNEYAGSTKLYISINPLDLLCSAGGNSETGEEGVGFNPTKFQTCWSTHFSISRTVEGGEKFNVTEAGCYSNVSSILALGSILNRGLLYVKNGSNAPVYNSLFVFHGYKERSHIWLDVNGIWVENFYPSKNSSRIKELREILKQNGINVIDETQIEELQKLKLQDKTGNRRFIKTRSSKKTFLDRVAMGIDLKNEDEISVHYLKHTRVHYDYDHPYLFPESCMLDNYVECCMLCGDDDFNYDELLEQGGLRVCPSCAEERMFVCQKCGHSYSNELEQSNTDTCVFCN